MRPTRGIEEFFDEDLKTKIDEFSQAKGQINAVPVVTGKPWATEDLKKKSFEDLHKLWFVLIKERNMLATEILRYKAQPEISKMFGVNTRLKKVRKSMARIQGLLHLRKHEYHRYLGLLKLKELKDNNIPLPKKERKQLLIQPSLPEDVLFKRRVRSFYMVNKNKLKRKLLHRMQHHNNKLGKRFDHRLSIAPVHLEKAKERAIAKAERRKLRDVKREELLREKEEIITKQIEEQQAKKQQA
mmetsp:Transcript_81757/g.122816  ORF Transcript_81757/g.122816 Transcript_81757/m.122816 type:complete len:242 (-) Transcript_81757:35-760(-)|eukprot:CAMPEP_0117021234 /NCGR_PEP_ID=MMETSP0472-20121206/16042_1 /TAXON_ID=693140 ORGANISM="Tiarina fusus, Strain LIS" /NCGR_SAMPLE_ID=MMETSP0472 /ASSEMBLY_ACC=CAM_ASM_000603 /LENGTH=241 /DNA_ID=CAMNT_0004726655 /DNA_START=143 /DNA_END=868 /DNA_ORIENTATION=+